MTTESFESSVARLLVELEDAEERVEIAKQRRTCAKRAVAKAYGEQHILDGECLERVLYYGEPLPDEAGRLTDAVAKWRIIVRGDQ